MISLIIFSVRHKMIGLIRFFKPSGGARYKMRGLARKGDTGYHLGPMAVKSMIPLREFAGRAGVPYSTVVRWCQQGRIKGAILNETPAAVSYWMVPEAALDDLERPRQGRPPKPKKKTKIEKTKRES